MKILYIIPIGITDTIVKLPTLDKLQLSAHEFKISEIKCKNPE